MSSAVFANGMEVSCKQSAGKTICAFPDVCFTPPQTPATPPGVPIPYPNTAMAGDTSDGSTSVQIGGQEVMLKNASYFKKSSGNEAGSAPKKGVVTSTNAGKAYFVAWSMDVQVEGENVVRHLDMTTNNHNPATGNTPPMTHVASMKPSVQKACKTESDEATKACEGQTVANCSKECKAAQKCILVPKGQDKEGCCGPENTGDHMIEDHWIWSDKDSGTLMPDLAHLADKHPNGQYKKPGGPYQGAPTMCASRSRYHGTHGIAHGTRGVREDALRTAAGPFTYAKAKEIALEAHADVCKDVEKTSGCKPNCSKKCMEAQLDDFYGKDGKKKLHKPDRQQALKSEQREAAQTRIDARRRAAGRRV